MRYWLSYAGYSLVFMVLNFVFIPLSIENWGLRVSAVIVVLFAATFLFGWAAISWRYAHWLVGKA